MKLHILCKVLLSASVATILIGLQNAEARPCGSDIFSKIGCEIDPTNPGSTIQDLDPTKIIPGSKEIVEQAWGAAGSVGYQAAARTMQQRNGRAFSLDETQKKLLRNRYGRLVDQVEVVYDSRLMDEWCALGKCTPAGSAAQTYCDRIYVKASYKRDNADQLMLLAHEMRHFEQCMQLGGEEKFGFQYFREFKRANQTYATNSMEEDARNSARDFAVNVVCPQIGCYRFSSYYQNYEGWGIDLPVNIVLRQQSAIRLRGVAHIQDIGDVSFQDGEFVGSRGQSRRLEGFSIQMPDQALSLGIQYMAHVQNVGDTSWFNGGQFVGSSGQSLRLEGFAIQLTGSEAANHNVLYKCHVQNIGDTQVLANGQFCGTRGQSLRLEGLQVWIERR